MKPRYASLALAALILSNLPLPFSTRPAFGGEVLDPTKVGAALALLYVTETGGGENTVTSASITNTSATDEIVLDVEVISGDPRDDWSAQSFHCPMSPGETTQFVFEATGTSSARVTYECSIPGSGPFNSPGDLSLGKTMALDATRGIMWVTISGATFPEPTLSKNVLEGRSAVIDFQDGAAYEVGAVAFQSPMPEVQDFDGAYEFDGMELAMFPEMLTASFHAPAAGEIEATLIVFTLDGRLSSGASPNAEATLYFFNDDEEFFNTSLDFECFAMIDLAELDSRFLRQNLGSQVGHLRIVPQSVDPNDENHDGMFGDDDNRRYVGILGWLVEELEPNATLLDAQGTQYGPLRDHAAIGSLLTTSVTPLPAEPNDVPALRR